MALFVVAVALSLAFISPGFDACRKAVGRDFLAFYAAGTLVREGRTAGLYDLDAIRRIEQDAARSAGFELGDAVGPWWNPPLFAWAFAPLAASPFSAALSVWTAINFVVAAAAVGLLARIVSPAASDRALFALLVLCSAPLLQSIAHGQNSAVSLLLVALVVTAWRRGASFTAGACVGLLAYKPQLAAILGVVLVLHRGRRAAAGLLAVGGGTLLLTALLMPGALSDYLARLPQNLHAMQVAQPYLWDRHVTLRAFWRLLLQGRAAGETAWVVHALTFLCAVPLLAGLAAAAIRSGAAARKPAPRGAGESRTDELIAAALAAAPLLMPFYFDYDLLLLTAAAALVAPALGRSWVLWAALYGWLFVNPYLAGPTRLNLTVPLLFGVALTLTDRALHGRAAAPPEQREDAAPPALARAA